MVEIERLADQLQRAFYLNAWCGPSLLETLEGVNAAQAAARPLARAHSMKKGWRAAT